MIIDLIYSFDYPCFILFLMVSYGINSVYPTMNFLLSKSEKYRGYNKQKQYYIIKNIIKSLCMSVIFFFLIFTFIPNLYYDIWNDSYNRIVGAFYVANDLAGLFTVPNLPQSTKFHHYTSVFLFTLICSMTTEEGENVAQLIVVYTIFSCIPYLVNSYLALRFYYNRQKAQTPLSLKELKENQIIDFIRIASYYLYFICCLCNWSYHALFLLNRILLWKLNLTYIIYYILLVPIINDDIVLLQWLKTNRLEL